ncbi:MAG: stage III sporulation protein AB, partial [Oscillospiraceae bacterium]|nr:stage III sporulation protein AB [Oscillospiraceae bacterium]
MYKLIGIIMIVTACGYIGINMSSSLKRRVEVLELLNRMTAEMKIMVQFRSLTVKEMLKELIDSGRYSKLGFLQQTQESDEPFHGAWGDAVGADKCLFDQERAELLVLGARLGTTDTVGQVANLTAASEKFTEMARIASAEYF